MAADPYKYFRLEARDLLEQFAKGVLELEKHGGSAALVQQLLRLAHTLKGAARVVKQQEIADRAHAIEDALSSSREPPHAVTRERIEAILGHLDEIGDRIPVLAPAEGVQTAVRAEAIAGAVTRTVRADIAEMDAVLDGISETHALLNGLRTTSLAVEQAQHLADVLVAQLTPRNPGEFGRQAPGGSDRIFSVAEELRTKFAGIERDLGSAVDQMDRELHQLRDAAEQLRLVSVATLFTALERTARDTAQALSKRVAFEGKGGDIRLDSHVLETVQDALVQIVRNAVAHGIELETERRTAGKPDCGQVTVEVSRRGRRIVFDCRDDGRGVDLDAVRRVAQQRGLLASAPERFGAEDIIRLLLRGGISTSKAVTALSGRGIGLDVVREAIERVGGDVGIRTEPGKGTAFQLVVPPSLASMEALLLEASDVIVSIPLEAVRGSLRVAAHEISRAAPFASILYQERAIPFAPLSRSLDGLRPSLGQYCTAVIVAGAAGLAAIGVDRLLGTTRIVARPLPEQTPANAVVAGASLDADGNPQLVLDPDGLVAEAHRGDASDLEPAPAAQPVLVVDDSMTTRMLEQSILESAGYEVDVALSGEQALESARRKRYGLFLVDVEMPGMDGFTFIERIRSDPLLHAIPAILVTSRSASEDRRRGDAVGAQGYIVKSEFDQARLLALIKPLMG